MGANINIRISADAKDAQDIANRLRTALSSVGEQVNINIRQNRRAAVDRNPHSIYNAGR